MIFHRRVLIEKLDKLDAEFLHLVECSLKNSMDNTKANDLIDTYFKHRDNNKKLHDKRLYTEGL